MAPSQRSSLLQPTAVNSILAEVNELKAAGRDLVSLMRGEPDFATPPHIVDACVKAMREGRTSYPDNRGEIVLRRAIAGKLSGYDPGSEILVTTGATFGIYAAMTAILNNGDEVLLPDPVYDAYQSPIRLAGGRPRPVRSSICNQRFTIDRTALESAWTPACRVLLLNTPWNPVGTVFTRAELEEIGKFVEERNLLLISDEIYEAITYDGCRHLSPVDAVPALRDRTILVNSLSKTYSMTGWRVGYCAGPTELIQSMFLVLQQSSRGPSTFVQYAAAEALSGPQDCVAQMREEYSRRREQVIARLAGIAGVRILPPEGGFFAMADARDLRMPSAEIRKRLMHEHGVVVVHGAAYGAGGEGTLRISFASGGDTLARGLDRLREGLARIAESRQ